MPVFDFKAIQGDDLVFGEVDARDQRSALESVSERFDQILELELAQPRTSLPSLSWSRVNAQDLSRYTLQLSTMLNAGIPLIRVLEILCCGESRPLNDVFETVRNDVRGGMGFSSALARHPEVFPPQYVGLVGAGEASGRLVASLVDLASSLERSAKVRRRLISTLTYPAITLTMGTFIVCAFTLWIMPVFGGIFGSMGLELPLLTRTLLKAIEVVSDWRFVLPVAGLTCFLLWSGYKFLVGSRQGRKTAWNLLQMVPLLGPAVKAEALHQVLTVMSMMLKSGVKFSTVIPAAQRASTDPWVREALDRVLVRIETGKSVTDSFQGEESFPSLLQDMIRAGEEAGELVFMLKHTAGMYEMEFEILIDRLLALAEPLSMAVLGAMAGIIVLAAFEPTIHLMDSF